MTTSFTLLSLLLLTVVPAVAQTNLTADQVMAEQKRRHGVGSELVELHMLLTEKNGSTERRIIKRYDKETGEGLRRSLTVFVEPADVKGAALLTWGQKDRHDDQWLYLPSTRRLLRIAVGNNTGYFMGTDFTYEDMDPEDLADHHYSILRAEEIEGQDCYVVVAVPSTERIKRGTGYSKRILWIGKDIFFPLKIEFYDRRDRHVKTLTNHDLYNAKDSIWRAKTSVMDNLGREHKTVLGVKTLAINTAIDDEIFTQGYLISERHIQ